MAGEFGREMELPQDRLDNVKELVMATCHQAISTLGDQILVVDIDLAILGQPLLVYQKYEKNIALEFKWVPEDIFPNLRKHVIEGFLNRPSIFTSPLFQDKYEELARKNLAWSLEYLSSI